MNGIEKVIEVQNVSFGYSNELVLSGVSIEVQKGDFVGLVGTNGSGKSTLIKLLLGELSPSSGSIKLFGEDVSSFRKWPFIGYVPQNAVAVAASFPATVMEVVMSSLYPQIGFMRLSNKGHKRQAMQALELVGMQGYSKRMIGELSGGQQQRVMLARVLAADAQVMLLDEPTTGIDVKSCETLYELLGNINKQLGVSIVMVTHDLARTSRLVDRVLCLEESTLVELDDKQLEQELKYKHKHDHPHTH